MITEYGLPPTIVDYCTILASVILGIMRLIGFRGEFFQAIAHLYIGGLIGAYLPTKHKNYLIQVVILSIVEVFAFIFYLHH